MKLDTASEGLSTPEPAPEALIHRSNSREVDLLGFHRLGDRSGLLENHVVREPLHAALFADYDDLTTLRHDFPVILSDRGPDGILSLSDAIDATLQKVAIDDGAMVRQTLEVEHRIRVLLDAGTTGTLSSLWQEVSEAMLSGIAEAIRPAVAKNLATVKAKMRFDGEILDYQPQLSVQLITYLWQKSQLEKSRHLITRIDRLKQKLSDILRVDYLHSSESRSAERLENALGSKDNTVFDFQAMSRILKMAPVGAPLPPKRKQRISDAITVFESQRFVSNDVYTFAFDHCDQALQAFDVRMPEVAKLIKAISIAELEIENRYDASRHDPFYDSFDADHIGREDLALFPTYLVCLVDDAVNEVPDILRGGLPFKVVVVKKSLIGERPRDLLHFGTQGQHLAQMAMGLNDVFVMQAAASSLYQLRDTVMQGLSSDHPALLSLYAGYDYLSAAAATESRVFPTFVFDPSGGAGLATKFQLLGNPAVEQDWQLHNLHFEDADQKKLSEQLAYTLVDFAASDTGFSKHFVRIAKSAWNSDMLPVHTFLETAPDARKGKVPYILLVDENDQLIRAVCDAKIISATEQNLALWHRLQELAGIHNAYVTEALQQVKKEAALQPTEGKVVRSDPKPEAAPTTATAKVAPTVVEEDSTSNEVASDDPWIETIRCTSCNECTDLNGRLFGYDDDLRAHISDPDAGTYKELVEAAENCQVAIIHPGKPRNPDEPGLEDLIVRAAPFMA